MKNSKVILITGASSGMGKETARILIQEGHIVYGAARRIEQMQDLVKAGGHAIKMDVSDETQLQAGVQQILREQNRLDVLINNAGYGIYGSVEETRLEDARQQFEVNLFGLARLTQLVLPTLRAQKSGTIINISSMGGKIYTPMGAWYHASKHALEGWSDCLRLELAPLGIHVVIIEPGAIATEFGEVILSQLMTRSGQGPYSKLAQKVNNTVRNADKEGNSSPASLIARLIAKAVNAENPRTRYAAGKWAKPMIWLRRNLSDRLFDKVVMSQFN